MERRKRLVRVFFNTFYEDVAKSIIKDLGRLGEVKFTNSKVVPELYYVEISVGQGNNEDVEAVASEARKVLEKHAADGKAFGFKVYTVVT
jgi:Fe-S oxidoreductase